MLPIILALELRALGFAVPDFVAVAALGVRAVITDMTVLVAAKAFDMRAVFPRVALLHQSTVSARFGIRPNNHFDDRRRLILGGRSSLRLAQDDEKGECAIGEDRVIYQPLSHDCRSDPLSFTKIWNVNRRSCRT